MKFNKTITIYFYFIFLIVILSNCNDKPSWSDELAYQELKKEGYGLFDENRFNCIVNNQIWNKDIRFFFYDNMEYNGLFIYKFDDNYNIYKSDLHTIYSNDLAYTLPPKTYYELKSISLTEEEIDRIVYLSSFFSDLILTYGLSQVNYIRTTNYLQSLHNFDNIKEFNKILTDTVNHMYNEIDTSIVNCDDFATNLIWVNDSLSITMLNAKINELNNIKRFIQNEYNIDSLAKIENNNLYYTIPKLEIINFERIKQNDSTTIRMTKINKYDYKNQEKSWLIAPLWEYK